MVWDKNAYMRKWMKNKRMKMKQKAIEYTGGEYCHGEDCKWDGEFQLHHIDFHHVISENKKRTFGSLFTSCGWDRIKKEIDDCKAIPLCAMCHRDMEWEESAKPLYTSEDM